MSRRQWAWVVVMGVSLVYLLAAGKHAYEESALGIGATGFLRNVVWALTVLAPVANVLGILGAIKQQSTAAAFRIVNSLVGRLAIVGLSAVLGTLLLLAPKPAPVRAWDCTLVSEQALPPRHERCGEGEFVQMRLFDLDLHRASSSLGTTTIFATATHPESSLELASRYSEHCVMRGPNYPQHGSSQLELTTQCGADRRYPIQLAICDSRASAAKQLHEAVTLRVADDPQNLSCEGAPSRPRDAGVPDAPRDAVLDAPPDAGMACPEPPRPPMEGYRWLFVRAQHGGMVLDWEHNHAMVRVQRSSTDDEPGKPGEPDDPCLLARLATNEDEAYLRVSADYFITQRVELPADTCTQAKPCPVDLLKRLNGAYYAVDHGAVRIKQEGDIPAADRASFRAALAFDVLERSRELRLKFDDELERTARATGTKPAQLAIDYADNKLQKKCTASCLRDTRLDSEMRGYLGRLRPGAEDPFDLRGHEWRGPR